MGVPGAPRTFKTITPSDTTLLDHLQWIRVGGAGNMVIKGVEPDAVAETFAATAGEYVPFGSGYVMAATTATGLKGFG